MQLREGSATYGKWYGVELSEENKKLLQDFITAQSELGYANAEEQFVAGFRLGAKIILEIFEKDMDDEQLQSIIG